MGLVGLRRFSAAEGCRQLLPRRQRQHLEAGYLGTPPSHRRSRGPPRLPQNAGLPYKMQYRDTFPGYPGERSIVPSRLARENVQPDSRVVRAEW